MHKLIAVALSALALSGCVRPIYYIDDALTGSVGTATPSKPAPAPKSSPELPPLK